MHMPADILELWTAAIAQSQPLDVDPFDWRDCLLDQGLYYSDLFDPDGEIYDEVEAHLSPEVVESLYSEFQDYLYDVIFDSEITDAYLRQLKGVALSSGADFGSLASFVLQRNPNLPEEWMVAAGQYLFANDRTSDLSKYFFSSNTLTAPILLAVMESDSWDRRDDSAISMFISALEEEIDELDDDHPFVLRYNDLLRANLLEDTDLRYLDESLDYLIRIWEYSELSRMSPANIVLLANQVDQSECDADYLSDIADLLIAQRSCPRDAWPLIAKWPGSEKAHIFLAEQPDLPPNACEVLAYSDIVAVRSRIAEHPNLPTPMCHMLSQDSYSYVRVGVALNPNAPLTLVALLTNDEDDEVVEAARAQLSSRSAPTFIRAMGGF